jgi:hypothetical protein
MTWPSAATMARVTTWWTLAFNAGVIIGDVIRRDYHTAALLAIAVTPLVIWLGLRQQYLDAWLTARRDQAIAERRTAELVATEMEKMRGALRVGISVEAPRSVRMN